MGHNIWPAYLFLTDLKTAFIYVCSRQISVYLFNKSNRVTHNLLTIHIKRKPLFRSRISSLRAKQMVLTVPVRPCGISKFIISQGNFNINGLSAPNKDSQGRITCVYIK